MSGYLVGMIYRKVNLPPVRKLVLNRLADHADDDGGKVFPGAKSVARCCGLSVDYVKKILRDFRREGILVTVKASAGPGSPNHYRIDLARAIELYPMPPLEADEVSAAEPEVAAESVAKAAPEKGSPSPPIAKNGGTVAPQKGDCGAVIGVPQDPLTIKNHQEQKERLSSESPKKGEPDLLDGVADEPAAGLPAVPPDRPPKPQATDPPKRGTRLPETWQPSPADLDYARKRGLNGTDLSDTVENFTDYWTAKPGAGARKLSWTKTWRTWVRRDDRRRRPGGRGPGRGRGVFAGWVDAIDQSQREHDLADRPRGPGGGGGAVRGPPD